MVRNDTLCAHFCLFLSRDFMVRPSLSQGATEFPPLQLFLPPQKPPNPILITMLQLYPHFEMYSCNQEYDMISILSVHVYTEVSSISYIYVAPKITRRDADDVSYTTSSYLLVFSETAVSHLLYMPSSVFVLGHTGGNCEISDCLWFD